MVEVASGGDAGAHPSDQVGGGAVALGGDPLEGPEEGVQVGSETLEQGAHGMVQESLRCKVWAGSYISRVDKKAMHW